MVLHPKRHLTMSGDILSYWTGKIVLLSSSEWRPEMLLNVLQCIGQPPSNRELSDLNVNGARMRNSDLEIEIDLLWITLNRKNP